VSTDNELLGFITECLDLLAQYSARGREAFLAEHLLQDAVVRRMEILADAAGRLSDDLKERHPAIPWRAIVGFRNVVAHAYMGVAMERVWEYLTTDLPALRDLVDHERA
jgi:uncharacterized protein with HEPN domain